MTMLKLGQLCCGPDRLRAFNLLLFSLLPLAVVFSRTAGEIIIAVIGLSFLSVWVAQRRWRDLTTGCVGILLVTWVVLNVGVSPQALNPEASFGRSLPWIRFVLLFAAASLWLLRSAEDLKFVQVCWLVILALVAIDGFVQFFAHVSLSGNPRPDWGRLTGPLSSPNIGKFVAFFGFPVLALTLFVRDTSRWSFWRWGALIAVVATFFALVVLSGERTMIVLTTLAIFLILGGLVVLEPTLRLRAACMGLGAACIPVILFVLMPEVQGRVKLLWFHVSDFWSSPYGILFRTGGDIWLDHPLLGVGLKNFREIACSLSLGYGIAGCLHPHNIYIEWLSETGLIGLTCFLVFVTALVWPVLCLVRPDREHRLTGLVLTAGLTVILFPVATTGSFFTNWLSMLTWPVFGVIAATTRLALTDPQTAQPER